MNLKFISLNKENKHRIQLIFQANMGTSHSQYRRRHPHHHPHHFGPGFQHHQMGPSFGGFGGHHHHHHHMDHGHGFGHHHHGGFGDGHDFGGGDHGHC